MMKKHLFIFLVVAPLLAFFMVGVKIYHDLSFWTYQGPKTTFTITSGESFSRINGRLAEKKLISNPKLFYRYCKFKGYLRKFRTGEYLISPGMNMLMVIDSLLKPSTKRIKVTITEGKNIFEIGRLLEEKKITTYQNFLNVARDEQFIKQLGIPAKTIEGYLFPDTYIFAPNTPAKRILHTMHQQFKKNFQALAPTSSKLSKHEIITLASIVEKETGAPHERPTIAGVFHNRLKKGMRLQSDPTTIYGIFETFDGNLKRKHLREKNNYNTYRMKGLPIGPISNPGKKSLEAVIKPQKHNYLFFVSKNDGTHVFTRNYRDHRNAVAKWQKSRKNRIGKSWRDLNK
jgi:UPF0755 protein